MFERFTERARKVMGLSRHEAQRLNSEFIGTEHVLLGIAKEGEGTAAKALNKCGVEPAGVIAAVEKHLRDGGLIPGVPLVYSGQIPFSPRCKRVIELAGEVSFGLGFDSVATEHLLLGVRKENEGIGSQVLSNLGITLDKLIEALTAIGAIPDPTEGLSKVRTSVAKYGRTGPSFATPNGTLLTIAELITLVQAQVVSPAEVKKLVWGEDAKS